RAGPGWVDTRGAWLSRLRSRPVLAAPYGPLDRRADEIQLARERARRAVLAALSAEQATLATARGRLTALGPAATMERGYAVVQVRKPDGSLSVLRSVDEAEVGTELRMRLADGAVHAVVDGIAPDTDDDDPSARIES